MANQDNTFLRVKSDTNVGKLAGCIKANYDSSPEKKIIIPLIGAGPLNQAVKAVIIVNTWLSKDGKICRILPSYGKRDAAAKDDSMVTVELTLDFTRI